ELELDQRQPDQLGDHAGAVRGVVPDPYLSAESARAERAAGGPGAAAGHAGDADRAAPLGHGHGPLWAEMGDRDRAGGAWAGELSALRPDAGDADGADPALAGRAQHRVRLRVPAGQRDRAERYCARETGARLVVLQCAAAGGDGVHDLVPGNLYQR